MGPGEALGRGTARAGVQPRQESEQALGMLVPMSSYKVSGVMGELAVGRRSNEGLGESIYDS